MTHLTRPDRWSDRRKSFITFKPWKRIKQTNKHTKKRLNKRNWTSGSNQTAKEQRRFDRVPPIAVTHKWIAGALNQHCTFVTLNWFFSTCKCNENSSHRPTTERTSETHCGFIQFLLQHRAFSHQIFTILHSFVILSQHSKKGTIEKRRAHRCTYT